MGEARERSRGLADLWARFRALPTWVQVVAWLVGWPLLAALRLAASPGGMSPVRAGGVAALVLVAGPLWLLILLGGGDDRGIPEAVEVAEAEDVEADLEEPTESGKSDDSDELDEPETPAPDQEAEADAEDERSQPDPEPDPDPEPETEQALAPTSRGGAERWTVVNVVDGDTVDVRAADGTEERVRVIGIDTPERGECGFDRATDAMAALVLNKRAELVNGARDDRDHYDRILRYVDVEGVDAGLSLVEKGLAISRYDSRDGYGRHTRQDRYVAADNGLRVTCDAPAPAPKAKPTPAPESTSRPGTGPGGAWKNCTEARGHGAAPVRRGDAGYGNHLDRDQDGVGCE